MWSCRGLCIPISAKRRSASFGRRFTGMRARQRNGRAEGSPARSGRQTPALINLAWPAVALGNRNALREVGQARSITVLAPKASARFTLAVLCCRRGIRVFIRFGGPPGHGNSPEDAAPFGPLAHSLTRYAERSIPDVDASFVPVPGDQGNQR